MKLTARLISVLVLAFLIAPIVLFQGCGDNKNIPDGSTITILPETNELIIAGEVIVNLKVIARYTDGAPIPYANLVITGGFAAPAAANAYQFYWDPGGNAVANPIPVDSGFKPQTDESGVYDFSIVVFGTTAFTDTIYATSGTAVGTADLTVSTGP
jgi:hypothetical protein